MTQLRWPAVYRWEDVYLLHGTIPSRGDPMAERKSDADATRREGEALRTEMTSEEREHAAAARAVGQPLGPRKLGGTIIEADGRVTYTRDGAVSATAHGPVDPTIQPGQFEDAEQGAGAGGGVKVVDRTDAAPLTGDASATPREEKK